MHRSTLIVAAIGLILLLPVGRSHAQADVVINVTETITVSDQVPPVAAVSVNETVTVSDEALPPAAVSVNETITVSDEALPLDAFSVDETIIVSDEALPLAAVSVNETITGSDLVVLDILPGPPIGKVAQQAKLGASDGAAGDQLGLSAAISGVTAVLGAPFTDPGTTTDAGAVHIFVRSGTVWSREATLVASDAADNDNFGISVAIDRDTVVVGAEFDDALGVQSGSAYVYP